MNIFLPIALLLAVSFPVAAKDLYVDASSGDDSVTYAENSSNNPWRSIGRAAWGSTSRAAINSSQAAQAGDTVIVNAGVYTTSQMSGERYIPAYNPANSGNASNPIIFRANGLVTLRSNSSSGGGPIIGTQNKSHIMWDGFFIDEPNLQTVSDTAPVVIWDSNNITIQNLTINGVNSGWNDNHNGIRVENSSDSLVTNNRIYGIRNGGMNANGAAVMVYGSSNITFEHNEISDSGSGIFIKGRNPGPFVVRYNKIYDIDSGAVVIGQVGTSQAQNGALIYQNILRDSAEGVTLIGYDSSSPANINIVNNTIDNCTTGGLMLKPSTAGYLNILIQNNIVTNSSVGIQAEDISDLSEVTFSHNIYSGNSTLARLQYTNYSFSSWLANQGKDTEGSMQVNPQYVNLSSNDFRLSASSPAINAGVDILNLRSVDSTASVNMGAYLTGSEIIGITSSLATVPQSPIMFP